MLRMVRNTVFLLVVVALLACWSAIGGHWQKAAAVVRETLERPAVSTTPAGSSQAQPLPPGHSVLSRAYEQIKRMEQRQPNE